MKIDIQRFNISNTGFGTLIDSPNAGSLHMSPNPMGEWCKYSEVVELLKVTEIKTVGYIPQMRCEHKIEIPDSKGIAVTYCSLAVGHEGKCEV